MCGIAGLYLPHGVVLGPDAARGAVGGMTGAMVHRGPDADGIWSDSLGRCVLGHRRLSIIDTSDAGVQPMTGADGRHVVTFNGELYNYQEIRPTLQALGRRFQGRTDTEVLLEAMAEWGVDALPRFDGMFAFAMFDAASGALTLARDPFGEKPLYYTRLAGGAVAFASELQALERCPGFDARVDVAAMAEVLSFQYIGAPRCIYASVKKLQPGCWMRIDPDGGAATGRYFAYQPGSTGYSRRPLSDLADELEDILVRSIARRMIADVPLGAFLSGGVDSSTVCALVRRKLGRPLKTFSMGFLDAPESEHLAARAFAEHLGTEHYDEVLEPDISGFLTDIGSRLDEPNADSSCLPTYLLSRFARRHVTVSISGDGGDEMFGGYGRYFSTLDDLARRRRGEIGGEWTAGGVYYGNRVLVSAEPQVEQLLGFVPPAYAQLLCGLRARVDASGEALLGEMRRTDAENYMPGAVLPKVDRMSMQCSLEVRTPFLNAEVARFAERLPDAALVDGTRGKLVLREIAYRYLPRELVDLPKKGFGLPLSDWARASMLEVAGRLLENDDSRLRATFGPQGIARFMAHQRTPGQFSPYQVWATAMLESWLRHHPVELPSAAEAAAAPNPGGGVMAEPDMEPALPAGFHLMVLPLGGQVYAVRRVECAAAPAPCLQDPLGSAPTELAMAALELVEGRAGEDAAARRCLLPAGEGGRLTLRGGLPRMSEPVQATAPPPAPVNFQPRDISALEQDLDYAVRIARFCVGEIPSAGMSMEGLRFLELGPGINFGPQLILASLGAQVSLADRFLAPWDEGYHPQFYTALAERWSGPADALRRAVADGGYHTTLALIAEPAEALSSVRDHAFDMVMSNAVLEHVFDFAAVAREMARVTRPGGYNAHQIDFRDHRNFDRPLEFLLEPDEAFEAEFRALSGERGNRVRAAEAEAHLLLAGFEIQGLEINSTATDAYLADVLPRLRRSPSSYRDWPEQDLRTICGRFRAIAADSEASRAEGRWKAAQIRNREHDA